METDIYAKQGVGQYIRTPWAWNIDPDLIPNKDMIVDLILAVDPAKDKEAIFKRKEVQTYQMSAFVGRWVWNREALLEQSMDNLLLAYRKMGGRKSKVMQILGIPRD